MAKAQEVKDVAMSSLAQAIEDENKEQWRAEGRSMLFDAKRVSSVFVSLFIIFCFIFKQRTILTACGFQPALTLNLERHHYVHFYVYRPLLATSANCCSNNNNTEKKETCHGYYKLNKMSLDSTVIHATHEPAVLLEDSGTFALLYIQYMPEFLLHMFGYGIF